MSIAEIFTVCAIVATGSVTTAVLDVFEWLQSRLHVAHHVSKFAKMISQSRRTLVYPMGTRLLTPSSGNGAVVPVQRRILSRASVMPKAATMPITRPTRQAIRPPVSTSIVGTRS